MSNKGHYGVSFPFRIGVKGGIAMSGTNVNSARHIEESIQQILSTRRGERVMETFFYLIRTMLAMAAFGFTTSKIKDEVIRTVCLTLGGTLLFIGVLIGLSAML